METSLRVGRGRSVSAAGAGWPPCSLPCRAFRDDADAELAAEADGGANDGDIEITASIGIAVFARDIASPEEMLKQADVALYCAKDSGRNQYHFHSEEPHISIVERVTLAGDQRHAIERDEFELLYQPLVRACEFGATARRTIASRSACATWDRLSAIACPHHRDGAERS